MAEAEEPKIFRVLSLDGGGAKGFYLDGGSAFSTARAAKRANPNLHVAVMDPRGISTPID
jgi:hypothetical protein